MSSESADTKAKTLSVASAYWGPQNKTICKKFGLFVLPRRCRWRKMAQGHAGDVPMHRLPTQLLLSSEIRYFSAGTPSWNSPEFPLPEFRPSGEEGAGTTFHTLDIWDSGQILAQECQESIAE